MVRLLIVSVVDKLWWKGDRLRRTKSQQLSFDSGFIPCLRTYVQVEDLGGRSRTYHMEAYGQALRASRYTFRHMSSGRKARTWVSSWEEAIVLYDVKDVDMR
jgi:hypothetical protein